MKRLHFDMHARRALMRMELGDATYTFLNEWVTGLTFDRTSEYRKAFTDALLAAGLQDHELWFV